MAENLERFTAALAASFDPGDESHRTNVESVKTYFGLGKCPAFDGASFESYAIASTSPFAIEAADLVAVTLLSMEIRRKSKSGISTSHVISIDRHAEAIALLLQGIPIDRDLHDLSEAEFEELIGDGSLGMRLWRLLRDDVGMHRVATFKLLARKRPRLFPIADSRTVSKLGRQDNWWRSWYLALSARPEVVDELRRIRDEVGAIHAPVRGLSLLRVADIVLWGPKCDDVVETPTQ